MKGTKLGPLFSETPIWTAWSASEHAVRAAGLFAHFDLEYKHRRMHVHSGRSRTMNPRLAALSLLLIDQF